jgi:quinolinate synthase
MQVAAIAFDRFKPLQDDACNSRIVAAKAALGRRAVVLGHHYQRADVYKHADLTGDSLKSPIFCRSQRKPQFCLT